MQFAALIVVSIGAACDLKTNKIPNKLTFPASGFGIILQSIYFASWSSSHDLVLQLLAGLSYGVLGWFMGVLIMSITKLFMRQFGHGDTKLVAAVGSFLGPWHVLLVYFYYMASFGVYGICQLLTALPWSQFWISAEMKKAGVTPVNLNMDKFNEARKKSLPVAPFIAIGTVLSIILEKATLEAFGIH